MTKIWVTLIANDSVAILTAVLKPRMSNIFHSTIKGKYIIYYIVLSESCAKYLLGLTKNYPAVMCRYFR